MERASERASERERERERERDGEEESERGCGRAPCSLLENTFYIEHIIHTPSECAPSLVKRRERNVFIRISSNESPFVSDDRRGPSDER
jgi:hypothetical protein